jgi:hypothetical protein
VVAAAIWRRFGVTIGSVVGAGAIFAAIILFFAGEYIEINRFFIGCRQAAVPCRITLSEFARYAICGIIGFVDVAAVFALGLMVDERRRRKWRSPNGASGLKARGNPGV